MIRVDLGKEELKASKQRPITGGKISLPKNLTGGKNIAVDIISAVLIVVSGVVALLPQPFVTQYIENEEQKHEARVAELKTQISSMDREIASLKPYQSELDSYTAQKKVVNDRLNTVQRLLNSRGTPVTVLDTLGQNLPSRAWIRKLDFSLTGEKKGLVLSGLAYSNEEISDFMDALNESIYFSTVTLQDVTTVSVGASNIAVKKFDILAEPKI